jgi:hypothetical protein
MAEENQALQNADAISSVGDDAMGVPPVSATETVVSTPDAQLPVPAHENGASQMTSSQNSDQVCY